jgi:hypothetical protein
MPHLAWGYGCVALHAIILPGTSKAMVQAQPEMSLLCGIMHPFHSQCDQSGNKRVLCDSASAQCVTNRNRRDNFQQGLRPTGPAMFSARHSTPHT